MSQPFSSSQTPDSGLRADATLAAGGDQDAIDRLFAQLGGSAWGIAFVTTEAVGPATDAVADGFAEVLQTLDNGLHLDDVKLELLRATRGAAVRTLEEGDAPSGLHAREPVSLLGETKDRQATLALTALSEPMRSALWLADVEQLPTEQTASLLQRGVDETDDLIRDSQASFRRYYADAVKRDGLSEECSTTLDNLAAYAGETLPAGEMVAVETHLASCDSCRSILNKMRDMESRLRAAIPPVPAWTRQHVMDTWSELTPASGLPDADASDGTAGKKRTPLLVGASALLVVLLIAGVAAAFVNAGSSDNNAGDTRDTTSSRLATPSKPDTSVVIDDRYAVATPKLNPQDETPVTAPPTPPAPTVAPEPSTAAPAPPTTSAPATNTTPRTRSTRSSTPATTARTNPPTTEDDELELIDLPPTPNNFRNQSASSSPTSQSGLASLDAASADEDVDTAG